jgi:hypothetical protein
MQEAGQRMEQLPQDAKAPEKQKLFATEGTEFTEK